MGAALAVVREPDRLAPLAVRERSTSEYWSRTDPIYQLRTRWRAQTARQVLHILPGETILELACGSGGLTRALASVTRGECPITAVTFACPEVAETPGSLGPPVEVLRLTEFPGPLRHRRFDYVVATNVLDRANVSSLLRDVQELLRPGGRLLFFETNPWNPVFRLRRSLGNVLRPLRRGDERELPDQLQLYELLSAIGFVRVMASCYDFLYWPIPRWLMLLARNLTLVLENTKHVRKLAGTILLHAQRPPLECPRPAVRMVEHEALHGSISVVVPCHNEEMNVEPLVAGLVRHYDQYVHEFVLVDDNSTDGTAAVLRRLAASDPRVRPIFRRPPNGVGLALRDGLAAARGRYVLLMDCDFIQILPELRDMFDAVAAGHDVVLGSRFSRESVLINYPLRKILFNRVFHVLASLALHRRLRDVTNNLKLLSRTVVDSLELESPGFSSNAETGLKPILMGYRTSTVPISWINRTPTMGRSSFALWPNAMGYVRVLASLTSRSRLGFRQLPPGRPRPASEKG